MGGVTKPEMGINKHCFKNVSLTNNRKQNYWQCVPHTHMRLSDVAVDIKHINEIELVKRKQKRIEKKNRMKIRIKWLIFERPK